MFATGTELLPVDAPLEPGKIRDSNSAMVAAMVVQYGGEPVVMGTLPDRVDAVVEALTAALAVADCIVTTGGVSVGDYDVMAAILSRLKQQGRNSRQACQNREGAEGTMPVGGEGAESTMPADVEGAKPHDCDAVERFSCDGTLLPEPESAVSPDGEDDSNRSIEAELHSLFQDDSRVLFDKVAMRPGSPTSAMLLGGKPLFALSGNPGACFVGFELFVRPALSRMQGDPEPLPLAVEAELTESIIKGSPHERYVRAKLLMREGRVLAEPLGFGKSSMMASIPEAEALLVVPPGSKGVSSGERVKLIPIQR
nr:molybdopterin molybdotransferase MoeA [Paenibacillus abyssi]